MKRIKTLLYSFSLLSTLNLMGIEDLRISVSGTNAVLNWPSLASETYIVQYRPTLLASNTWQTLTNSLPAATGTNRTWFIHRDIVRQITGAGGSNPCPTCSPAPPGFSSSSSLSSGGAEVVVPDSAIMPPFPWDPTAQSSFQEPIVANEMQETQSSSFSEEPVGIMGFYRVVRNGVYLIGVANNEVVSGIKKLPIEIGLVDTAPVLTAFLDESVDDAPPGVTNPNLDDTNGPPVFIWNTHRASNGNYTLTPAVVLQGNTRVLGATINVTVANQIQTPEWIPYFGTTGILPIRAIVADPTASYTISITNSAGVHVRTLTGTAVNSVIDTSWDGLDSTGNPATGFYFDVTMSYNPSLTERTWFEKTETVSGKWVITHQKLYTGVNETVFNNNVQQIVDMAVANYGVVSGSKHVINTGPANWIQMANYLKQIDSRNLYYFGHGSSSSIGFGNNDQNNGRTARSLRIVLNNIESTDPAFFDLRQPYRFVFLDGCSTGVKGGEWAPTFGIMPIRLDMNTYNTILGSPARAFLGWKKGIYTVPGFDSSRHTFTLRFFQNWLENEQTLEDAARDAAAGTIGLTGSQGFPGLQIWGAFDLPGAQP